MLYDYHGQTDTTLMPTSIQRHPDVNRVEVISVEGEEIIWDEWDECSKVRISFHDDGKTLKVFLLK